MRLVGRAAELNKRFRVLLASKSPRRREILQQLGVEFEVVPSGFDETSLDKAAYPTPAAFVEDNARCKAKAVLAQLDSTAADAKPALIIAADTVVTLGSRIFEKPETTDDACAMLRELSGKEHAVVSGVALAVAGSDPAPSHAFTVTTKVRFAALEDAAIAAYVATGEPMDKAGSYGIQALGGAFAEGIEGDYFNVVGLPMHALSNALADLLDARI